MRVLCTNDKKLPQYAEISAGNDYEVLSSRINNFGQKIYFLEGVVNNATTDTGFQWNGYDATRFAVLDKDPVSVEEFEEVEEDLAILN